MSYLKGTMETQLANMSIENNLSNLIEAEEYIKICSFIIKDVPENIKINIKKILGKFRSRDRIAKFISALISILNSDLNLWKFDNNIKEIFNELEEQSVSLLLLLSTSENDKINAQKSYNNIMENQFQMLFDNLREYLDRVLSVQEIDSSFSHMTNLLINFTKLIDIKGFDAVLFPMAKFAETLLTTYINREIMHAVSIDFIAHINHRLINYLAVTPGSPVSKGLREAINIYNIVRQSIIDSVFVQPEVIGSALSILEHRSRFFGLNADAIPENENHGDYIVLDPLNAPFEDDDVYEDYDKFLATLPNN